MIRALSRALPLGAFAVGTSIALTGAAPGIASTTWVKDAKSGCATSNPYPNPNETITWFGNCRDGKLDGRGTLVWYRDGKETERNEGAFKQGEMDGYAVTTYPEGYTVHGQYKQGQRHGQFMTVRASGEYVRATYYNGKLVDQAKLTPIEAQQWRQAGGPQLIASAAPPSEPPRQAQGGKTAQALPAQQPAEEFITGRTAVASPSRIPPQKPKPAAAQAAPAPAQTASAQAGAKPSSNFVLGTQVIDAIQPVGQPAVAAPTAAAAAGTAVGNTAAIAARNAPVPQAAAVPLLPAPTQPAAQAQPAVQPQLAQVAPAAQPPAQQAGKDAGGFYLSGPSLTSPPLPGSAKSSAKSPTQPAGRYQLDAPQAPVQPLQPAQPLAPALPGTLPTAGTIASPSLPGLPNSATAAVPLAPQGPVNAGTGRRPPWMAAGAPDPVLIAGGPVPGMTPPPLSPTPMAGAAPLAGPAQPYVAPVYAPPPPMAQAYQPMNLAEISPTEASRQYLAQREAAQVAQSMTMPSYRAMQPSQPMAAPNMAMANSGTLTNIPSANPNAPAAIFPVGSPEAMFKDGYKLEMSGRLREAEQVYEQIILSSSNSQTAMLANDRLNNLRRNTREQGVRIAEQPPRAPERQSGVVAVNEPRNLPRYAQPTGQAFTSDSGAGDASGGMTANLTGLNVCSQRGLYDKESRWCGMVLADDGARLSVEIKDVVLPGFGNVGIQSSKCSGGTFINWFSRGSMVRVPRSCMELKG
ncbi:MAG: hypothetical protein JNM30_21715 [Rhodospirillales bacterium]|nr:hypothetical protein [Rhodospirillales bacterium]